MHVQDLPSKKDFWISPWDTYQPWGSHQPWWGGQPRESGIQWWNQQQQNEIDLQRQRGYDHYVLVYILYIIRYIMVYWKYDYQVPVYLSGIWNHVTCRVPWVDIYRSENQEQRKQFWKLNKTSSYFPAARLVDPTPWPDWQKVIFRD